jgi:hypothetical protein
MKYSLVEFSQLISSAFFICLTINYIIKFIYFFMKKRMEDHLKKEIIHFLSCPSLILTLFKITIKFVGFTKILHIGLIDLMVILKNERKR